MQSIVCTAGCRWVAVRWVGTHSDLGMVLCLDRMRAVSSYYRLYELDPSFGPQRHSWRFQVSQSIAVCQETGWKRLRIKTPYPNLELSPFSFLALLPLPAVQLSSALRPTSIPGPEPSLPLHCCRPAPLAGV